MIEKETATATAKYIISITDNKHINYFDIITVTNIMDTGEALNISTEKGDIFIDKKYCVLNDNVISAITNEMELYLERITCNLT